MGPMLTKLPNKAQTVLSLVSPANKVHDTTPWKCDSNSALAASSFAAAAFEMAYAYVEAGNHLKPYCVPLPQSAGSSLTTSYFMTLGYALKKYEQSLWAAYYDASTPASSIASYLAADSFYQWSRYVV